MEPYSGYHLGPLDARGVSVKQALGGWIDPFAAPFLDDVLDETP